MQDPTVQDHPQEEDREMSAYLCNPYHIGALAQYTVNGGNMRGQHPYVRRILGDRPGAEDDFQLPSLVAAVLAGENWRSVEHRYPDATPETMPGPGNVEGELSYIIECSAASRYRRDTVDGVALMDRSLPVRILKALDCYEYQACETPDYQASKARELVELARGVATKSLPGYDSAEWGWIRK